MCTLQIQAIVAVENIYKEDLLKSGILGTLSINKSSFLFFRPPLLGKDGKPVPARPQDGHCDDPTDPSKDVTRYAIINAWANNEIFVWPWIHKLMAQLVTDIQRLIDREEALQVQKEQLKESESAAKGQGKADIKEEVKRLDQE